MNFNKQKIYKLISCDCKDRLFANILIRAYSQNETIICEILRKLPDQSDRLKLLKYINKEPRMSRIGIRRIVDTYLFYHVTLKKPLYRKIYETNNYALLDNEEDKTLLRNFVMSLEHQR